MERLTTTNVLSHITIERDAHLQIRDTHVENHTHHYHIMNATPPRMIGGNSLSVWTPAYDSYTAGVSGDNLTVFKNELNKFLSFCDDLNFTNEEGEIKIKQDIKQTHDTIKKLRTCNRNNLQTILCSLEKRIFRINKEVQGHILTYSDRTRCQSLFEACRKCIVEFPVISENEEIVDNHPLIDLDSCNIDRLYNEQSNLKENTDFDKILETTAHYTTVDDGCLDPPILYFFYKKSQTEPDGKRLKDFLKTLGSHLDKAGMTVTEFIEIEEDKSNFNHQEFGDALVFNNIFLINFYRQNPEKAKNQIYEVLKRGLYKKFYGVYPILLIGDKEHFFPPHFNECYNFLEWNQNSYLENIQNLIHKLYNIDEEHNLLKEWQKFKQKNILGFR